MPAYKEVVLDDRRRTSLARIGRKTDERYLVEEHENGTLVFTPAVTITQHELDILRSPKVLAAIAAADKEDPSKLIRRRATRLRAE
jgi:hypothetical protein